MTCHRPAFSLALLLSTAALYPGCSAARDVPAEPPPRAESTAESAGGADAALPARAFEIQARGLAQLENETPAEAEGTYRELLAVTPSDPLPWANLAVAQLRQQKPEEALESIGMALERAAAGSVAAGRVQAIHGAILDWTGEPEAAFDAYRAAAEAAPEDPQILYALYRQSDSLERPDAVRDALDRLAASRPDNFVVLVESGKQAVRSGDRTAATEVYLRLRELLWQAPPIATTALEGVLGALEVAEPGALEGVRVPAARLENVLKITPMYRESLRELSSGIQAVPLVRFAAEGSAGSGTGPGETMGDALAVTFAGERLSETPTARAALALADLDGDGALDAARAVVTAEGIRIEVRPRGGTESSLLAAAPGESTEEPSGLLAIDLRNDGASDLVAFGTGGVALWSRAPGAAGSASALAPAEVTGLTGGSDAGAVAATTFDYDVEADLDLVLAGASGGLVLLRNVIDAEASGGVSAAGSDFEDRSDRVFPGIDLPDGVRALAWSDVDRDGDPDLLAAGGSGLRLLDNLRSGTFSDRTAGSGLEDAGALLGLTTADLDGDGLPDLVATGPAGLRLWKNATDEDGRARFEPWHPPGLADLGKEGFSAVIAFDADNDGRLDLALAGRGGAVVVAQDGAGGFTSRAVSDGPGQATVLAAADLDGDGDLDLLAAGPEGLHRLINEGGNRNHWLSVRLRGLTQGNGKNNVNGVGATVEVIDGRIRQLREHDGGVSHFGLGSREAADVLRVVWNNGVPQNRLGVAGDQTLTEEQVLKGSCPFLYTWNGAEVAFVTDLLWGAPVGLPAAEGVYIPADGSELVEVTGAQSLPAASGKKGIYDLRVTEELWEAAYFDAVRLWVVDHPADVTVASSLRIVPGVAPTEPPYSPDRVLGTRDVRAVTAAVDGRGRDVTARVAARDDVYADGYEAGLYQGLARRPWTFTFDLGGPGDGGPDPGGEPVRLLLDGWIFPTDASINIALSQVSTRGDALGLQAPRLEVETGTGWVVLLAAMGHPAGKTKTMVVDTPPLPAGAHRLRIVTNQWISWDRIAWSPRPADGEPRVVARLAPERAELRFRGFSKLVRRAPNAPHEYDYSRTSSASPWGASPGPYTRFGDVRELLAAPDSRPVVLGPGDEIALRFDTSDLPPPAPGSVRTLFLESHGWDKDYDKHTWAVDRGSLPLPFQGMTVYPWGEGEHPPGRPSAEERERFREEWLTREAPGPPSP